MSTEQRSWVERHPRVCKLAGMVLGGLTAFSGVREGVRADTPSVVRPDLSESHGIEKKFFSKVEFVGNPVRLTDGLPGGFDYTSSLGGTGDMAWGVGEGPDERAATGIWIKVAGQARLLSTPSEERNEKNVQGVVLGERVLLVADGYKVTGSPTSHSLRGWIIGKDGREIQTVSFPEDGYSDDMTDLVEMPGHAGVLTSSFLKGASSYRMEISLRIASIDKDGNLSLGPRQVLMSGEKSYYNGRMLFHKATNSWLLFYHEIGDGGYKVMMKRFRFNNGSFKPYEGEPMQISRDIPNGYSYLYDIDAGGTGDVRAAMVIRDEGRAGSPRTSEVALLGPDLTTVGRVLFGETDDSDLNPSLASLGGGSWAAVWLREGAGGQSAAYLRVFHGDIATSDEKLIGSSYAFPRLIRSGGAVLFGRNGQAFLQRVRITPGVPIDRVS